MKEEKVEITSPEVSKPEETAKPSKKKSKLPLLLGVFGILAFILVLIVWYSRPLEKVSTSKTQPAPTAAMLVNESDPISLLYGIRDAAKITEPISDTVYYFPKPTKNKSENETYTSGKAINVSEEEFDVTLGNTIGIFLINHGFEYAGKDQNAELYLKGDILCRYDQEEVRKYLKVYCGKVDPNYQVLVKEMTPFIISDNKIKKLPVFDNAPKVIIYASDGDFITGNYKVRFVAKKENSKWNILYLEDLLGGIESPSCEYVKLNKIPYSIQDVCIKDQNLIDRKFVEEEILDNGL